MKFDLEIGRLIERTGGEIKIFRPVRIQISERRPASLAIEATGMFGRLEFGDFIGTSCPTKALIGHERPSGKGAPSGFAAQ